MDNGIRGYNIQWRSLAARFFFETHNRQSCLSPDGALSEREGDTGGEDEVGSSVIDKTERLHQLDECL